MRRAAFLVLCLLSLTACQSTRSWQNGCADVYSGARYYAEITPTVPFDGKLFFTLDLIPTLIVDTLALPVTAFAEPHPPRGGFALGCRWATP